MSPDPLDTALVAQLQPVRRDTASHRSLFRLFLREKGLLRDANAPRWQDLCHKSGIYSSAVQMKTTLNLDGNSLRHARVRAAETGETRASSRMPCGSILQPCPIKEQIFDRTCWSSEADRSLASLSTTGIHSTNGWRIAINGR